MAPLDLVAAGRADPNGAGDGRIPSPLDGRAAAPSRPAGDAADHRAAATTRAAGGVRNAARGARHSAAGTDATARKPLTDQAPAAAAKTAAATPADSSRAGAATVPVAAEHAEGGGADTAARCEKRHGGHHHGGACALQADAGIPEAQRHRRLSVVALARFHVVADGNATVTLLQATPDPGLNAGLMAALQKWRFFPAMDNGRPVASTIDIRVPIEVR